MHVSLKESHCLTRITKPAYIHQICFRHVFLGKLFTNNQTDNGKNYRSIFLT